MAKHIPLDIKTYGPSPNRHRNLNSGTVHEVVRVDTGKVLWTNAYDTDEGIGEGRVKARAILRFLQNNPYLIEHIA